MNRLLILSILTLVSCANGPRVSTDRKVVPNEPLEDTRVLDSQRGTLNKPAIFWAEFVPSFYAGVTVAVSFDSHGGLVIVHADHRSIDDVEPLDDRGDGRFSEFPVRSQGLRLDAEAARSFRQKLDEIWMRPAPEFEPTDYVTLDGIYTAFSYRSSSGDSRLRWSHCPDPGTREHAIVTHTLDLLDSLPFDSEISRWLPMVRRSIGD